VKPNKLLCFTKDIRDLLQSCFAFTNANGVHVRCNKQKPQNKFLDARSLNLSEWLKNQTISGRRHVWQEHLLALNLDKRWSEASVGKDFLSPQRLNFITVYYPLRII